MQRYNCNLQLPNKLTIIGAELSTNNSQTTNKTNKQLTSNLSQSLRYRGIFPDRLNTFIIMDNVENVICCDRGNDALAYAAMANNKGNDPMALAAMMNGGL